MNKLQTLLIIIFLTYIYTQTTTNQHTPGAGHTQGGAHNPNHVFLVKTDLTREQVEALLKKAEIQSEIEATNPEEIADVEMNEQVEQPEQPEIVEEPEVPKKSKKQKQPKSNTKANNQHQAANHQGNAGNHQPGMHSQQATELVTKEEELAKTNQNEKAEAKKNKAQSKADRQAEKMAAKEKQRQDKNARAEQKKAAQAEKEKIKQEKAAQKAAAAEAKKKEKEAKLADKQARKQKPETKLETKENEVLKEKVPEEITVVKEIPEEEFLQQEEELKQKETNNLKEDQAQTTNLLRTTGNPTEVSLSSLVAVFMILFTFVALILLATQYDSVKKHFHMDMKNEGLTDYLLVDEKHENIHSDYPDIRNF